MNTIFLAIFLQAPSQEDTSLIEEAVEVKKVFSSGFWRDTYENFADWIVTTLPSIALVVVLLIVSLWVFRTLVRRAKKIILDRTEASPEESLVEKEKRIRTLVNIIKQAGSVVIWVVFLMTILKEINIDIAPILASAGIVGLAVGFGAQELVRDFISGFFMLLENQVRAGDVAVINGQGGLVEEIALRTVTLRDFSGTVHIFQNGKINTLANMTKEWSAMVFDVGVAYKENTDQVTEIMKKVGEDLKKDPMFEDKIIEPLEIFGVDKFADSAVVIKARFKTKPIQQWNVGREYNTRLKKAFDEAGIEIPFPHRTIFWGDSGGPVKLSANKTDKNVNGDQSVPE